MNKFTTVALVGVLTLASSLAMARSNGQHTFATELQEVRAGSIDGREYLTIHIDDTVGPATCHGNVLKVDTAMYKQHKNHAAIESVALSAMLRSESVMLTVPLENGQCVDGMPTITNIYLLPTSP